MFDISTKTLRILRGSRIMREISDKQLGIAVKVANVLSTCNHQNINKWLVRSSIVNSIQGRFGAREVTETDRLNNKEGETVITIESLANKFTPPIKYSFEEATGIALKLSKVEDSCINDGVINEANELAKALAKNQHKGEKGWYVYTRDTGTIWSTGDNEAIANTKYDYLEKGIVIQIKSTGNRVTYDLTEARAIVNQLYSDW